MAPRQVSAHLSLRGEDFLLQAPQVIRMQSQMVTCGRCTGFSSPNPLPSNPEEQASHLLVQHV